MVSDLDFADQKILMEAKECGFMACCGGEVSSLGREDRRVIRKEMRVATMAMLLHLQSRIPWGDAMLQHLAFLDPKARLESKTPEYGVSAAIGLKRFTAEEQMKLAVQLNMYQDT